VRQVARYQQEPKMTPQLRKSGYEQSKSHLLVHPALEFLVIYETTFFSECSFDWATGPFFVPPTAKPTR
jgi:hypothetical protein